MKLFFDCDPHFSINSFILQTVLNSNWTIWSKAAKNKGMETDEDEDKKIKIITDNCDVKRVQRF